MIHAKDAATLVPLDCDDDSGLSNSEESDLRSSATALLNIPKISGSVWQQDVAGSNKEIGWEEKGLLGANRVRGRAGRRVRAQGRRRAARRRTGRCL